MAHLMADERKCRRDGLCVAVCPVGIIELKDEKVVPTPVEGADQLCINCGHCVAVCPYGAMSLYHGSRGLPAGASGVGSDP